MSDTYKDMIRHGREPKTRSGLGRCAATGKRMFHSQEEALEFSARPSLAGGGGLAGN